MLNPPDRKKTTKRPLLALALLALIGLGWWLFPTPAEAPDPGESESIATQHVAPENTDLAHDPGQAITDAPGPLEAAWCPPDDPARCACSRSLEGEKWFRLPEFEELRHWGEDCTESVLSLDGETIAGQIEPNEAISSSLGRYGIPYQTALDIQAALKGVFDFRKCRPGNDWAIHFDQSGQLDWFVYNYNRLTSYLVRREGDLLMGYAIEGEVDTYVEAIGGQITYSLSVALWKQGESDALTQKIADIFAWDIDFYSDIQKGDRFRALVEKRYYNDEFLGYGRVLAASFHGQTLGDLYAYYFETPDGSRAEYFDDKGNALQKSFLRAPLNTTRVTSSFGFRMHPTLHKYKKHNGIDYGAPSGTPVWAIASGKVMKAGWMGACGKGIVLRHVNRYQSVYCHLSSVNVRAGHHVRQKEMIGRVGSTGRSTGPHLHFGLMKNGAYINPLSVKYEPGKPLEQKYLAAWTPWHATLSERLKATPIAVFYGPEPPPDVDATADEQKNDPDSPLGDEAGQE